MTTREKLYFLYLDGTIRHQHLEKCLRRTQDTFNKKYEFKKVSWEEMHIQNESGNISKAVFELLFKYGLKTTIFNCSNLEVFGFTHLYDHDVEIAKKNGCKVIEVQ